MDVLYVFISPAEQDFAPWLNWRAALHAPPSTAIALGAGAPLEYLTRLPDAADWKTALEISLRQARAYSGFVLSLPQTSATLTTRMSPELPGAQAWQWLLVSNDDGASILTALHVDGESAPQTARQAFNAAMFAPDAPDWRGECGRLGVDAAGLAPRADMTHLLTLARTADPLSPAFLAAHSEEEGDAADQADELGGDDVGVGYAHVGYSFTTIAAPTWSSLIFFAPATIRAQAIWYAQKNFRDRLSDAGLSQSLDDSAAAPDRLVFFERFRFNFELWGIACNAFEDSLRPWQRRYFNLFKTAWRLEEMRSVIERGVERLCTALEASVRNTSLKAERRQAQILYVLAVVQIIGLVGVVTAYFDLVSRAGVNLAQVIGAGPLLIATMLFLAATVAISLFLIVNRDKDSG